MHTTGLVSICIVWLYYKFLVNLVAYLFIFAVIDDGANPRVHSINQFTLTHLPLDKMVAF